MCRKFIVLFILLMLMLFLFLVPSVRAVEKSQQGMLSIYFMEEKVGYEEYAWESDDRGYLLSVKGRITKPIPMRIDQLTLHLDNHFIADQFYFKGSVNGMDQEISSSITEGRVENTILVAGQERKNTVNIRRDSFLLPNPVFSPYLIITKKYRCSLKIPEEKLELSAYIIPQLEVPFLLRSKQAQPCCLIMEISGIEIELQTDSQGDLKAVFIPSQKLKVIRSRS
ncbi:MAG: hypothetical protein ACLFVG_01215 [Candidatus Aminicenantes bacterium]